MHRTSTTASTPSLNATTPEAVGRRRGEAAKSHPAAIVANVEGVSRGEALADVPHSIAPPATSVAVDAAELDTEPATDAAALGCTAPPPPTATASAIAATAPIVTRGAALALTEDWEERSRINIRARYSTVKTTRTPREPTTVLVMHLSVKPWPSRKVSS